MASEGTHREDLSRDEVVARVWEWKRKYGGTITNQLRRLGASCDWSREHFTLDDQLSQAVVDAFIRLHEKGLIYQGTYMVNWSPHLQTAVSDLEVEYSDEPGALFYFNYPVSDGSMHDILFFWVARMVMMGIEFTGRAPFSYVYLHGLVRDSQDINLSLERLGANKAFTNKLWNAGKYILQNLPPTSDTCAWNGIRDWKFDIEDSISNLCLSEHWVVSKLHEPIDLVTSSYERFYYGEVGRVIYDFFWSEFADWLTGVSRKHP